MSAYALPGLFPPLPLEKNIDLASSSHHTINGSSLPEGKINHGSFRRRPSGDIEITVKDSKIDSLQLIQSLTSAKTCNHRHHHSNKRSKGRRHQDNSETSSQDLAMLFELEVSYQERRYTIVRSLFRLRQLREELVEECHNDCNIPELPALIPAQSFSLLQAAVRSHARTLDVWFQKLQSAVSSEASPALAHFLLEPLCLLFRSPDRKAATSRQPRNGTKRRIASLESIEELQEEDHTLADDDDGDDA